MVTTDELNDTMRTYKTGYKTKLNKERLFDLPIGDLVNLMCVIQDPTNGNYMFQEFIGNDEETV